MIYILAGNAAEAANYCREHNISLPDARYVHSPELLRGLVDPEFAVTGTFWDSPRAIDIWRVLLIAFIGKPTPQAPPEIQKFLHSTLITNNPVTSCVMPTSCTAGFMSVPGDSELEPIEEPEPVVEKKKKKNGFKSIRK